MSEEKTSHEDQVKRHLRLLKLTAFKRDHLTWCILNWIKNYKGHTKCTSSEIDWKCTDIHAIVRGRVLFIKVKTGEKTMDDYQKEEREWIECTGGLYFIATSMTEFITWFKSNFE